jgi:hypothetical protein
MLMEMVVESMKMAPGAIPYTGRVPKQRLLSLKIDLRWRWRCGAAELHLEFLPRREYIGGRAMSEDGPGPTPPGGTARGWPAPPYGAAANWSASIAPPDSVFLSGK